MQKNAYNKTEASLVTLTDKQSLYNDKLKAEKIQSDILFINKPLTKEILATI